MSVLIVFFTLLVLTLCQVPPLDIPFPVLPLDNITFPTLTGKILFSTGCRGIAREVVMQAHGLGATVVCTSRNPSTFNYSTIPSNVKVYKLEYGKKNSEKKCVDKFIRKFGRIPDYINDGALEVWNGNLLVFTPEQLHYQADMYINGPILLESAFMSYNTNLSKPVHINYALSTATKAMIPIFQEYYNTGKKFKEQHIKGTNAAKLYPNVRMTGVLCTFTDTTISATSYNPSALMGDTLQQRFQAYIQPLHGLVGRTVADVAKAHLQALLFPNLFGGESLFQVPQKLYPGPGIAPPSSTNFYMDVFASGLTYQQNISAAFAFLNVTKHD